MADITQEQRDWLVRLMRCPSIAIPNDHLAVLVGLGLVEKDGSRLTYEGQFVALDKGSRYRKQRTYPPKSEGPTR